MDSECGKKIQLHVKARMPKCKGDRGLPGHEGQPGKDGEQGPPGERGPPGEPAREKTYTNRWTEANAMSKNIASADPDRILTTLYDISPPVHVRCWRMIPSFETQEPIGYPSEISADADPAEPAETTFHIIITNQGFNPGWIQLRTTVSVNPDGGIIGPNFSTSFMTNDVFVTEPPVDRGRHVVLTTIRAAGSGVPHTRVFPQITRVRPTSGPEYEGEIYLESTNIRTLQRRFPA